MEEINAWSIILMHIDIDAYRYKAYISGMKSYEETAAKLKIMSDPVRLSILDMLACREMCACDLLEYLSISQSTLSHHMKILVDAGFVSSRKVATWVHYQLVESKISELRDDLGALTAADPDCLCFRKSTIEGEFCGRKEN